MINASPESSYKIITKQIFIPQETSHRVPIYLFVDPKLKRQQKAYKRYEGSTRVWTADHISRWGADW